MAATAEERFWAKVDKRGPLILKSRCWVWTASQSADGYGHFRVGNKTLKAHRWSYGFHIGPVSNSLLVCHRCDVPSCVNPNHLFLGTDQDNATDCINKGRAKHIAGVAVNTAKLTEAQVLDIR